METRENQEENRELFKQEPDILENAIAGLSSTELDYAPSNGGWTIRQIVHHLADGDDLWKTGIRISLGNEDAEFSLAWYLAFPQTEWAKRWSYEKRSIDTSLALLKTNRDLIIQLLKYVPDGLNKSVRYRNPNGEVEVISVEDVIQMQTDHIVHHIKRIRAIRKEISGK